MIRFPAGPGENGARSKIASGCFDIFITSAANNACIPDVGKLCLQSVRQCGRPSGIFRSAVEIEEWQDRNRIPGQFTFANFVFQLPALNLSRDDGGAEEKTGGKAERENGIATRPAKEPRR